MNISNPPCHEKMEKFLNSDCLQSVYKSDNLPEDPKYFQ